MAQRGEGVQCDSAVSMIYRACLVGAPEQPPADSHRHHAGAQDGSIRHTLTLDMAEGRNLDS